MTSNIEDLFGQIVSSEQEARKRKSQINEVKAKIQKCDADIHKVGSDIDRLQGQLVLKAQQYNDLRLQVDWEKNQEDILQDQKAGVVMKFTKLEAEFVELESEVKRCQTELVSSSRTFCGRHDLVSDGQMARQAEWNTEITQLEDEEKQLRRELSSYHQHQTDLDILSTQNAEQMAAIDQCKAQLQELTESLEIERQKTSELEDQKQAVARAPHQDPEFQKLQHELSSYKTSEMESVCVSLEQELQTLQRHQWQQKIQKRAEKRHSVTAARGGSQQTVRPQHPQLAVNPQPQTSTAVVLSNYGRSQSSSRPVALATVTQARSQPWDDDAEPVAADVPSGEQSPNDNRKQFPNIKKISSALKQQSCNTERFRFRRTNSGPSKLTNGNSDHDQSNHRTELMSNQIPLQQMDDPIKKKQRLCQQE